VYQCPRYRFLPFRIQFRDYRVRICSLQSLRRVPVDVVMARKIKSIFISRPDVGAAVLSGLNAPHQPPLTSLKLHGIYHPHADRRSKSCLPRGITSCTVPLTAVQLERMRAGVFLGTAVRYPRMRFDVDIHSLCTKHRNFSQTYACSAMQLMTPPPTRVFEIIIRAVC
jgi:hypothetical protein